MEKDLVFHFPTEETKKKYKDVLDDLFQKAKVTDEREFIIANLYFSGLMQISDAYDVKKELDGTIKDFQRLIALDKEEVLTGNFFIKLSILLYCHTLEFYHFYIFIYGLLDIMLGNSFDLGIFKKPEINKKEVIQKLENALEKIKQSQMSQQEIEQVCNSLSHREISNWKKLNEICKLSKKTNSDVCELIMQFFDNDLRNAFSHNLYTLSNEGVVLVNIHRLMPYQMVIEKIMNCFYFYQLLSSKTHQIISDLAKNEKNKFQGKFGSLELKTDEFNGQVKFKIHSSSIGKTL